MTAQPIPEPIENEFSIGIQQFIALELIKLIPIPCPGTYEISKLGFVRCSGKRCPTCEGKKTVIFQTLFSIMGKAHLDNLARDTFKIELPVSVSREDETPN